MSFRRHQPRRDERHRAPFLELERGAHRLPVAGPEALRVDAGVQDGNRLPTHAGALAAHAAARSRRQ